MASPGAPRAGATARARGTIEAFAPVRADLAGGTLDLWPLYCLHPGSITVNVALRAGVRVRLTPGAAPAGRIRHTAPGAPPLVLAAKDAERHLAAAVGFHLVPRGGFGVEVVEQPPVGSGLGASSAFAVALARACLARARRRLPAARLVPVLRDLEARVLGVPTGVQDYIPALTGGVLAIHLDPGGEHVERVAVPAEWVGDRLVVVFSGITHASGMVNWDVYRARIDGDAAVVHALAAIVAAAVECRAGLLARDEARVGRAVAAEWAARRTLAPSVTNRALDAILEAGVRAGALAGKACGAGGGGSVLLWARPGTAAAAARAALAAAPAGAFVVAGGVARRGATVRRGRATMAALSARRREPGG